MLFLPRRRSRHALQTIVRHVYFTTKLQNAAGQNVTGRNVADQDVTDQDPARYFLGADGVCCLHWNTPFAISVRKQ